MRNKKESFPNKCERCGKETSTFIMSMFNTQMICLECEKKERQRPDFEKAREREEQEVKQGNLNFKGIGL